jgi:GGDEF domain-containing protein
VIVDRAASVEDLEIGVRELAAADRSCLAGKIERYLEESLETLPKEERVSVIEEVAQRFRAPGDEGGGGEGRLGADDFVRLASLLLGRRINTGDLTAEEVSEKLALSVNTVFDMLNRIIAIIQTTVAGQEGDQETIRIIIGSQIEGQTGEISLQNYLGKIEAAFLAAHKAAMAAAEQMADGLLAGLDPDEIALSAGPSMKLWPLSDGRLFGIYRDKYKAVREWRASGRLKEDFLREFEKAYQALYRTEVRRKE